MEHFVNLFNNIVILSNLSPKKKKSYDQRDYEIDTSICNIYFQDVENVNLIKLNYTLAQFVKQILIYKVDIKQFRASIVVMKLSVLHWILVILWTWASLPTYRSGPRSLDIFIQFTPNSFYFFPLNIVTLRFERGHSSFVWMVPNIFIKPYDPNLRCG